MACPHAQLSRFCIASQVRGAPGVPTCGRKWIANRPATNYTRCPKCKTCAVCPLEANVISQRAHACMRVLHLATGEQAPALPKGGWSMPPALLQPSNRSCMLNSPPIMHSSTMLVQTSGAGTVPVVRPARRLTSTARPRACRHRRRPPQSAAATQHCRQASAQPPRPTRLRRGARRRS